MWRQSHEQLAVGPSGPAVWGFPIVKLPGALHVAAEMGCDGWGLNYAFHVRCLAETSGRRWCAAAGLNPCLCLFTALSALLAVAAVIAD